MDGKVNKRVERGKEKERKRTNGGQEGRKGLHLKEHTKRFIMLP